MPQVGGDVGSEERVRSAFTPAVPVSLLRTHEVLPRRDGMLLVPRLEEADAGRTTGPLILVVWMQRAAGIWRGSNTKVRRELLDAIV